MDVKANRGIAIFEIFPLLFVPVLLYNLAALFSATPPPGISEPTLLATMRSEALALPMLSGVKLSLGWGDLLLLLAVACLLVEVIKSARTASPAIMNHMFSMGVFVLALIEFLLLPSFASPTFFLLTMIALLDAMAGMTVTIISARRDFDVGGMAGS